ncbi:MAG TPA: macro domain-containing protein [Vicinamibacteria bacterium]|nr:macro domain-containing protein [Vicinamibacteria bacterium]
MTTSPDLTRLVGSARLELARGDITREEVDAVVNAANSTLLGGGGVDGAIHRAGGPRILEECRTLRAQRGPLPPGQAVITTAGRLPARRVVHAFGYPIDEAAPIALGAIATFLAESRHVRLVRCVLFSEADLAAYRQALGGVPAASRPS